MKKSPLKSIGVSVLLAFSLVCLFCNGFESPTTPAKTKASIVFRASTSKIYEGSLVDSVGKEIWIGAALYLPVNFDSVSVQVLDGGNTVVDTVFRTFRSEFFYDTIWVKHTFLTPGTKNITITPYSDPERAAMATTITIQGIAQNPHDTISEDKAPPEISFVAPSDTNVTISTDTFTVDLLCSDSSGVASVSADMGTMTFQGTLKNGHYIIKLLGFTRGEINVVTLHAKDSSASGNTTSRKLYFNYTTSPAYKVVYNGNGNSAGATPVDTSKYEVSALVTVKENTGSLIKTGATFIGWNTMADGSGTAYAGGVTFAMDSTNVILYAQWTTSATFTVTYNGNGNSSGVVPVDANKYETLATVTVKENVGALTKIGATFKGWNTAADGSGIVHAGGVTFAMGSADIVLYAQWTTNPTFAVTYDGNGNTTGTVPVDANKYETSASVTVKGNTGSMVKPGFTFAGWNTVAGGSGTQYAEGATFPIASTDVILYAQWAVSRYIVTFNSMEGSAVAAQTIEHGGKVTEPAAPTRTGYTFGGWYKEAAYTNIWNFSTETVTAKDTLFAKWAAVTYTVTFDDQTATTHVSPASKTVTFPATTVGTLPSAPLKTGYTFCCWDTAANGSGTEFTALTTVTANITVYAIWSSNSYTVTYDGQSVVTNSTKIVTSPKTTVETLPAPTASGYQFGGWFTGINGGGSPFLATTTVTSDITVYAKWTQVFSVIYNGNGNTTGTVPADANTYLANSPAIVMGNVGTLVRPGFTFAEWNTSSSGSGTAYSAGDVLTITNANVTLYARWSIINPILSQNLTDTRADAGDAVVLTVAANSIPGITLQYEWQKNGTLITGSTASLTLTNVTKADSATYRCNVKTSAGGNTASNSVLLSVVSIKAVSVGSFHSAILKTDGTLWTVGSNFRGQLGDGTETDRSTPQQVLTNVASISAGFQHTMAIKTDGTLWACGKNDYGQLGNGLTTNKPTFVQVMTGVAAVSAGDINTMIIKTDGTLWSCGNNVWGQVGDGSTTNRSSLVQIATEVKSVSVGYNFALFVKTDGSLWGVGNNDKGQLGLTDPANKDTPALIVSSGVASASAGYNHSMVIKTNETLWACGYNYSGQLGNGSSGSTDGVYTLEQIATSAKAVCAGYNRTLIIKTDGTLWSTGGNGNYPVQIASITNANVVSSGETFTMVLTAYGIAWSYGSNSRGQLCDGTTTDSPIPVKVKCK